MCVSTPNSFGLVWASRYTWISSDAPRTAWGSIRRMRTRIAGPRRLYELFTWEPRAGARHNHRRRRSPQYHPGSSRDRRKKRENGDIFRFPGNGDIVRFPREKGNRDIMDVPVPRIPWSRQKPGLMVE